MDNRLRECCSVWRLCLVCGCVFLLFATVNCDHVDVFAVSGNEVERNHMQKLSDGMSVVHNKNSTDGGSGGEMSRKSRRSSQKKTDLQQEEYAMLARENVLQMRSDSIRCATPRPRVIKVQDAHPHAYKRFVPSCVVLHRCDRESGCCDDENNVCSPVQKQRTFMYFYVVALGEQDGVASVGVYGQVERLRFTNHTRCGCRKRRIHPVKNPPLIGESSESGVQSIHKVLSCFVLWWFLTVVSLFYYAL